MPTETKTQESIVLEVSSATSAVLEYMFTKSKERGESDTRYIKTVEGYAETLLDYAIKRKESEWKSRDKQNLGKALREALDKIVNGKPLSSDEEKLVQAFREAA